MQVFSHRTQISSNPFYLLRSVIPNFSAVNRRISQSQWLCGTDVRRLTSEAPIIRTTILKTTCGKVSPINWRVAALSSQIRRRHLFKCLTLPHQCPKTRPEPSVVQFQLCGGETLPLALTLLCGGKPSASPVNAISLILFLLLLLCHKCVSWPV